MAEEEALFQRKLHAYKKIALMKHIPRSTNAQKTDFFNRLRLVFAVKKFVCVDPFWFGSED